MEIFVCFNHVSSCSSIVEAWELKRPEPVTRQNMMKLSQWRFTSMHIKLAVAIGPNADVVQKGYWSGTSCAYAQ